MPPQDDFASKVIKSLQKNNQAVDLTSTDEVVEEITVLPEPVAEPVAEPVVEPEPVVDPVIEPVAVPSSLGDVTAYGAPQTADGPTTGGNKDIIIVPGFGGAAATSVSQVNFYWRAPATVDITGFDTNVRSTIFNYALSTGTAITTPVLAFGGYDGTSNYLPSRNWNNAGTGVTAKVWINPFRGEIAVDYLQLNSGFGGAGATTLQGSFYYDVTQDKLRFATSTSGAAGFAKTVAFTDDIVTATTVFVAAAAGSTVLYPTFSNISTSGSGVGLSVDANINFNPALDVLTVPSVYSGTALSSPLHTSSAAVAIRNGANSTTGIQLQNLAGTSILNVDTTNSRIGINLTNPSTPLDISGSMNISGGYNIGGNTVLSSNTLGSLVTTSSLITVGTISTGVWAGTAITTLYGGTGNQVPFAVGDLLVANSATTLTKLPDVAVGSVLSSGGVGVAPSYVATSSITVGLATTANSIKVADTGNANTAFSLIMTSSATSTGGIGLSSDTALTYNPNSNLLTGTATTSTSVYLADAVNVNAPMYLVMSGAQSSASGIGLSTDAGLSYNPFTDTLTVGLITGTIAGIAQTARNLMTNTATSQLTHYLLFSPTAAAVGNAGVAVSTAGSGVGLSFNPSSNTLVSGRYIANDVIIGSAAGEVNTLSGDLKLNGATNNVLVQQDLTVTGNLVVNGTTFTVNTTVTNLEDPIITLSAAGGTQPNFSDAKDRGIAFNYFSGTAKTGFFGRKDSSNNFVFLTDAFATASEVFAGNAGTLEASNFIGNFVGLATTASQARVTAQTSGTYFPMLSSTSTDQAFSTHGVDASLSFDAANNILFSPTVYSGTALSSVLFTSSAAVAIKPGANSATGIQLQNFGGTPVLNVDTTNSRVGINNVTAPAYALDVNGDANLFTGSVFRINTVSILSSTVLGSSVTTSSLTTVGTITSGTWAGTAITTLYGGTGNQVPFVVGDLLVANSATTLTKLPDVAVGSVLASGGVGVAPSYVATSSITAGLATTANSIKIADAGSAAAAFNLLMTSSATSTSGIGLSTDAEITYNPSLNVLTAPSVYSGTALSSPLHTSSAAVAVRNGANSTTGIQLQNLAGTPVINVDTTNSRVGINNVTAPGYALDVSGDTNISSGSVFRINTASILSSTVLGSSVTTSSLTTVGTISSGTWAGTAITTLYGGTGNQIPFAVGDLLVANSATTLTKLPDVATGSVLASGGVGVAPSYVATSTLSVGIANTSANIAVADAATSNTNMYLLVGTPRTSTTAAGTAVSTNLNVFYNPSSNLLTTGGLAVTSSTALSSGTYLTVRTHPTDDNSTTDYFIRGLNSDNTTSKFSVDANGNLRATTKSFDIPHPTKPGKRLVYGVLEGPEHGVYQRGTVVGKSPLRIELPEYWGKLVGANYNVNLTTWGNYNVHIVEKNEKYFTIQLNGLPLITKFKEIKVDYVVHGSRLDAPLEVEQD